MLRAEGSLRDSRFITKFMYLMADDQFYEPFQARYRPTAEYHDIVTSATESAAGDWLVRRDGFWFHTMPLDAPKSEDATPQPRSIPVQGWKVHVSATLDNAPSILEKTAQVALSLEVPFKFALDKRTLSLMTSKAWSRSKSGKFLTLYPSSVDTFKRLLEDLYEELRDEDGPYVLSDKRYKDCKVLYYRYGGMARTTVRDYTGRETLVLISPDGEPVPDVRTPYFEPPAWAEDPFPDEESSSSEIVLKDRYVPKEVLNFSNSGGVYLSDDRETGEEVVVKEARPHTLQDGRGNDAVILLKREHAILEELRGTDLAAEPLDLFQSWENTFLVQEYLDGTNVREILLEQSPLMQVNPSEEDSREYYETCRTLFINVLNGLDALHQKGIIFGDLSATNLKIDPDTLDVRFIDFEGAHRIGVDEPTVLFTPTFKNKESTRKEVLGVEDDLYSVAALMFYMMFPIAALGLLRDDLFDVVLDKLLVDIGWSKTHLSAVIKRLSKNQITCAEAVALLEEPVDLDPPKVRAEVDWDRCHEISQGLGRFILDTMRPDEDVLFPADPFVHQTSALSLGFGACGVLHSLKKSGHEIPREAYDWLERQLDDLDTDKLPPGLLTGAAGIAWCLWELGFKERAEELLEVANDSLLLETHHSYFYGMAGVGMANLFFHLRTGKAEYLEKARELAATLRDTAHETPEGICWGVEEPGETENQRQVGLGYGQSGVALFFLRLHQVTGDEEILIQGRRALDFDLAHGEDSPSGGVGFPGTPSDKTLLPYVEEGGAGVAKVAMRYDVWDGLEPVFTNMHRKYSSFAGLIYGLGSLVDGFIDAHQLSGDERYKTMAERPVAGIHDLYLIPRDSGWATPGEGLFRITCDYATGVAGVMRSLHRASRGDMADFVLDELATETVDADLADTETAAKATDQTPREAVLATA